MNSFGIAELRVQAAANNHNISHTGIIICCRWLKPQLFGGRHNTKLIVYYIYSLLEIRRATSSYALRAAGGPLGPIAQWCKCHH